MTPLQKRQILIFIIGWAGYAATYLLRKPVGVIKTDLEKDLQLSKTELGWLDTALLFPYAGVQMCFSSLGDRIGPRQTLGLSMVIAGVSMITYGQWKIFYMLLLLLAINGSAQGMCWPNVCKILGSWYPDSSRNSIFSIFGTSALAGGVIGTSLAVYLQTTYGWTHVFFVPSCILISLGIIVYISLYTPSEVGALIPGKEQSNIPKVQQSLSFLELWRIPIVLEVAVSVFCLKIVRYCMYMWLPLFLLDYLKYSKAQAGMFSTTFEVGGIIGSAVLGLLMDKYFKKKTLVATTMSAASSTVALLGFFLTKNWGLLINSAFLLMAGAFNCWPDIILGGSLPAELGDADGRNAAAAVTGLVNGFGTLGTCIEGPVIGFITEFYGWTSMFSLMIILSTFGTLACFRATIINNKLERLKLGTPVNAELHVNLLTNRKT